MRIVHVTTELPLPVQASGGATRQFHLLSRLAHLGHDIVVVAPVTEAQEGFEPGRLLDDAGVRLVATPRKASREAEALAAFSRDPLLLGRAIVEPFYAMQTSMLTRGMLGPFSAEMRRGADVVTVEHDYSAGLAEYVPRSVPAVLTLQNVTWDYYRLRARQDSGLRRFAAAVEARRVHRYLPRRLERFQRLVAVSDADAQLLAQKVTRPIDVVPNGTSARSIDPPPLPRDGCRVLFTGTMNHPPNRDGLLWFADRVWPRILREIPEAVLEVVGRLPGPEILALGSRDGIRVVGAVASMDQWYADARVAVVPLHAGGGTRLKILDAMAWRRPVVTTSVGSAGLTVQDGRHVLVADDAETFAKSTVALLTDDAVANRLGSAGRQLAVEAYDWSTLGDQYEEVLYRAVKPRRPATPRN